MNLNTFTICPNFSVHLFHLESSEGWGDGVTNPFPVIVDSMKKAFIVRRWVSR